MIVEILEIVFVILTAFMTAYLIRHYIFTLSVLNHTHKHKKNGVNTKKSAYQPPVSILIPAYNEERVIGRILQGMTKLTYPRNKTQVIVVNDGSTDNTGEIAEGYAETYDSIKIINRNRGEGSKGKASALNTALKQAEGKIILCFDADYYPQRDIIEKLVAEFTDPKVGAVQGRVTVLNEPQNLVTRLVALERIGGYRVDQQARDNLGLITQFGGTVGGFRRSLLESFGGWDGSILAEDTDLTFRIYLAGYRVSYVKDAECYEEAVENWRDYRRQRYRWAKGHMQCFSRYVLKVLRSSNLDFREKVDGLLLLSVYFMPVLVLFSWIVGVSLFFLHTPQWLGISWVFIPISLYSFVGNFAPFFEVAVGAYLDGRTRVQWLIPLLIFTLLYNIPICVKALADLLFSKITGKDSSRWEKTIHSGNGNSYI